MRVLQPVTDRKESMALFEALRAQASSGAVAFPNRHVGFRGGGYDCSVYWRPDERIWGLFERFSHYKRFWICWGVRHPLDSCVITVETNPPVEGFDRRCSGVFLQDGEGAVYLSHSGRVGGGRKGIGKKAFRTYTQHKDWAVVQWPDGKHSDYLLLGRIGADDLMQRVASFVHEVARFKDWAVTS